MKIKLDIYFYIKSSELFLYLLLNQVQLISSKKQKILDDKNDISVKCYENGVTGIPGAHAGFDIAALPDAEPF